MNALIRRDLYLGFISIGVAVWAGWPTVSPYWASLGIPYGLVYGYAIRGPLGTKKPTPTNMPVDDYTARPDGMKYHEVLMESPMFRWAPVLFFILSCGFMLLAKLVLPADVMWGNVASVVIMYISIQFAETCGVFSLVIVTFIRDRKNHDGSL